MFNVKSKDFTLTNTNQDATLDGVCANHRFDYLTTLNKPYFFIDFVKFGNFNFSKILEEFSC